MTTYFIDDDGALVQLDDSGRATVVHEAHEWDGRLERYRSNTVRSASIAAASTVSCADKATLDSLGLQRVRECQRDLEKQRHALSSLEDDEVGIDHRFDGPTVYTNITVANIDRGTLERGVHIGFAFVENADGTPDTRAEAVFSAKQVRNIRDTHFPGRRPTLRSAHLVLKVPQVSQAFHDFPHSPDRWDWQTFNIGRLITSTYADGSNLCIASFPKYLVENDDTGQVVDRVFNSYSHRVAECFTQATERLSREWLTLHEGAPEIEVVGSRERRAYEERVRRFEAKRRRR